MSSGRSTNAGVAIVGGGLAGMAAAAALAEAGLSVELFEARRALGGRAGSFRDETTSDDVDHCQHVGMGCCTNLADFCRRTGIADCFRTQRTIWFIGPDGRSYPLRAAPFLPAPLHLGPSLWRLNYLNWRDKWSIAWSLAALARTSPHDDPKSPTIGQWLAARGASATALERFWGVVLVSALGESLERASLSAARKVFVDGFLSHRRAYELALPTMPLGELYGRRVADALAEKGVRLHLQSPVKGLLGDARCVRSLQVGEEARAFDYYLLAVPWRRAAGLLSAELRAAVPTAEHWGGIESSPIAAVHLWFDRPLMDWPCAALIDRLGQWVFAHGERLVPGETAAAGHYYQVVISASRSLVGRDREAVIDEIADELGAVFPRALEAKVLHWRMVHEQEAVFSVRPGLDAIRPPQATVASNLFLAGDWTSTGWPATMEGAIRSGYLAAEEICRAAGKPARFLAGDLPRSFLVRLLCGRQ